MASAIPITYVPVNTAFLSLAPAYAEATGSFDLYLGRREPDPSQAPTADPSSCVRSRAWQTWRQ